MGNERFSTPMNASATPKSSKNGNWLTHDEVNTLMSRTDADFFKSQQRGPKRQRTYSVDLNNFGSTQLKPRMLETRATRNGDFYTLGEGFKKVFANDKEDQKMVVPVVGYGGHRRGDRSQNYFGKSFRETTIKSKCLEREFRSHHNPV
jgi:hypothetical protein